MRIMEYSLDQSIGCSVCCVDYVFPFVAREGVAGKLVATQTKNGLRPNHLTKTESFGYELISPLESV
jgi:hypothetical protein